MEGRSAGKLNILRATDVGNLSSASSTNQKDASVIKPLPAEVIAKIKSSATIVNLTGAVIGLVQNSLDAAATKVSIDVDFARGGCTVEDNGLGIDPCEFTETGGIGKLYHTSKYAKCSENYGHHGTFLASLAALCLLTVTSKHHQHHSINSLIIHQSKVASRLIPAPASHRIEDYNHGTKIMIRDIFGNMPVRVKQRAVLSQDYGEVDKRWDELKSTLVALLIAYSSPVSLRLKEVATSKRWVLNSPTPENLSTSTNISKFTLSSKHQLALSILFHSGKIDPDTLSSWIPASASSRSLVIRGLMCLDPVPTKSNQYLSLNAVPLERSAYNILYDHINRLFNQSSFGTLESNKLAEAHDHGQQRSVMVKDQSPTRKQAHAEKGVDRWPMFVLKIQFKERQDIDETLLGNEAGLASIIKVLDALVASWLETHHFNPKKRRTREHTGILDDLTTLNTPYSKRNECKDRSTGTLDRYSRIKSSHSNPQTALKPLGPEPKSGSITRTASSTKVHSPEFVPSSRITTGQVDVGKTQTPFCRKTQFSTLDAHFGTEFDSMRTVPGYNCSIREPSVDETIDWVDPITNNRRKINARTGAMVAPIATTQIRQPYHADWRDSISVTQGSVESPRMSTDWLDEVLQRWDNPVFRTPEKGITHAFLDVPFTGASWLGQGFLTGKDIEQAFDDVSRLNMTKISKEALRNAKVLAQVDQKFILVLVSSAKKGRSLKDLSLLVAIDQHAADERCQVEELLKDLCCPPEPGRISFASKDGHCSSIKTTLLDKHLNFTITSHEAQLFRHHAAYFAKWGILYEIGDAQNLSPAGPSSIKKALVVQTLPPVIAERCRLEPKLVITLLRSEIWQREESRQHTRQPVHADEVIETSSPEHDEATWLSSLASCPQRLLDMLNSRACRSSIMFNDVLSKTQSEDLVERLSGCVFPFQCAHGRPSMVPLVDLGTLDDRSEDDQKWLTEDDNIFRADKYDGGGGSFADTFKHWHSNVLKKGMNSPSE